MMTRFSVKMLISTRCICGFMPKLHKKSWMLSINHLPYEILKQFAQSECDLINSLTSTLVGQLSLISVNGLENCNNAEVFLAADTISVQHSPLGSFISYCLRLNWAEIFKKQHIKKSWNDRKSIQLCKKRRNQVYACLLCDTLTKSIGVPVLFVSSRRRGNTVGSNLLWASF